MKPKSFFFASPVLINGGLRELGTLIGYISLRGTRSVNLGFRQSIGLGPGKEIGKDHDFERKKCHHVQSKLAKDQHQLKTFTHNQPAEKRNA